MNSSIATTESTPRSHVSTLLNNLRHEHVRRMQNASGRGGVPPKAPSFTFNDPSMPISIISDRSSPARLVINHGAPRSAPRPRKFRATGHHAPPSWIEREEKQRHEIFLQRNMKEHDAHGAMYSSHWRYRAWLPSWKESPNNELIPPDPSLNLQSEGTQFICNTSTNTLDKVSDINPDVTVPTLLHLCISAMFTSPKLLTHINSLPPHLLLFVARYAAVYHPEIFNNTISIQSNRSTDGSEVDESYTLLDMVAGVNGEFVYVGNCRASDTAMLKSYWTGYQEVLEEESSNVDESWDSPPTSPSIAPFQHITSIQLMSLPFFSILTLTPLLPTPLTHLSLLSFSSPSITSNSTSQQAHCLRRLSERCPRLEILDLSFNDWLLFRDISKVTWASSWKLLRTLMLRDCPLLDMKPSDLGIEQDVVEVIIVDNPWKRKQKSVSSLVNQKRILERVVVTF